MYTRTIHKEKMPMDDMGNKGKYHRGELGGNIMERGIMGTADQTERLVKNK
jgi:hypothetical protein